MTSEVYAGIWQRLIEHAGPAKSLRFDEFMDIVLYDPDHGYFSKRADRAARTGDFVTSPEISALFGACVTRWLERVGRPLAAQEFHVVEVGAGRGTLAESLLQASASSPLGPALRLHLVERGRAPRVALTERFAAALEAGRVHVYESVEELPLRFPAGAFLANELFDNLPVRRLMRADGWKEIRLKVAGHRLAETLVEAPADLVDVAQRHGLRLGEGHSGEVAPDAPRLLAAVASRFERGGLLLIDYGGPAEAVSGEAAPHGTLAAHRGHTTSRDYYHHLGDQDLTAHVNFTPLLDEARRLGFEPRLLPQAQFLLDHGFAEAFTLRLQQAPDEFERLRLTQLAKQLYHPEAMGEAFHVLMAEKGQ